MVFKPVTDKISGEGWELDPALPEIKYQVDGRINISSIAKDISDKLPVKKFKDHVEFSDVAGQIFEQVWPKWEEYFHPMTRTSFKKKIYGKVFKHAQVELSDK